MNKNSHFLWGFVLIILGLVLGLNALGFSQIDIFFDGWWTLFIIVPCLIGLIYDREKTGNFIGLLIGVGLLLGCLDVFSFDFIGDFILPVILIVIGCRFLFKNMWNKRVGKNIDMGEVKEYYATFSGQTIDYTQRVFDGCELCAVFGRIKCHMRGMIMEHNGMIKASVIFGGITINVPDDVSVEINSCSLFGGANYIKIK